MQISYAIHLTSGVQCVVHFDTDAVSAADVMNTIRTAGGEVADGLWIDEKSVTAIERMNDNKN